MNARLGGWIAAPLVACFTLGLAPFVPQPHVVEKLRWLATGHPLRPIDVFDLVLHGAPWVWLALAALARLRSRAA